MLYCSIGESSDAWSQLTTSILTTPLVALKKRGFNVDRLLNQQREQRLRSQAEASRESNNQSSTIDQQSNSMSEKGARALDSAPDGQVAKKPESIGTSGSGSSIMEQVTKRNPFMPNGLRAKLPNFMDNMPGAFNSKRGSSNTPNQGNGNSAIQGSQQSTKQASHLVREGPPAECPAQHDGRRSINCQDSDQYV